LTRSDASSYYDSLQIQFRAQLRSAIQALASYSWAHSIDNVSVDTASTAPANKIDPGLNRGSSDFDVRHTFTSALTFTLPKMKASPLAFLWRGWAFDTIVRARSALPVDVIVSRNLGFGANFFRPDVITGQPVYLSDAAAGGGRRIDNTRPTGVANQ